LKSIRQLAARYPVQLLCSVFELPRSCYYAHMARRRRIDVRRVGLRSRISELFSQSRSSAGSRSIVAMLKDEGVKVGRFKVRGLMKEQGLISKQPGSHAYKNATVERPDIPMLWWLVGRSRATIRSPFPSMAALSFDQSSAGRRDSRSIDSTSSTSPGWESASRRTNSGRSARVPDAFSMYCAAMALP